MGVLRALLEAYILVLFVRALLSWARPPVGGGAMYQVDRVLAAITEPVLRPIRRVVPSVRTGAVAIDLSVFVLFVICLILLRIIS